MQARCRRALRVFGIGHSRQILQRIRFPSSARGRWTRNARFGTWPAYRVSEGELRSCNGECGSAPPDALPGAGVASDASIALITYLAKKPKAARSTPGDQAIGGEMQPKTIVALALCCIWSQHARPGLPIPRRSARSPDVEDLVQVARPGDDRPPEPGRSAGPLSKYKGEPRKASDKNRDRSRPPSAIRLRSR